MQPLSSPDEIPPPPGVVEALHRLFEGAPSFVAVVMRPDYRYAFSNRKNRALVGCENMAGRTLDEVSPELVAQGYKSILDGVCDSGEAYVGHGVPFRRPGHDAITYLDFVYQPILDDRRRVIGIFSIGHDVTEHCEALQKAETLRNEIAGAAQELRGENLRFRRTLDHLPHMIWSTQPDGYPDYFSASWFDYTGLPPGPARDWSDLFHPDDQDRARSLWRHSLANGEPYEVEHRLRHRSGAYRWVVGRAWAERDASGAIVRWYGTCTDIHERVTAQEQVAELQSELIHISRLNAMGSMAATLAHEINQPLAAMRSYSSSLSRMIEQAADKEDLILAARAIERNALRAGEIIRRLREMTKRGKPRKMEVAAADLVREACALALAAANSQVGTVLDCPPGLRVCGDPIQIQQVLTNLIRNACEAVAGTPGGTVTIATAATGSREIEFTVEDNGSGIPDDLLAEIFDAFVTTKEDGMGIGLSVSRTIVEAGGGRIWAENRPEGGARFRFTVPAPNHGPEKAVHQRA